MLWTKSHCLQVKSKKNLLIREVLQKAQLIIVPRLNPRQKVMRKGLSEGQMLERNKQVRHQPRNKHTYFNSESML